MHHPGRANRLLTTLAVSVAAAVAGACTSFADVRSAEVSPGLGFSTGVTLATPPGDDAAWFWALDCDAACNQWLLSPAASLTVGVGSADGAPAYEIGLGTSGIYPHVEGYVQIRQGSRPLGVGVKVGVSRWAWYQDAVFLRYDVPLRDGYRLLFVPTLLRHAGSNDTTRGSFTALAAGFGLDRRTGGASWTLSVVPVVGATRRKSQGLAPAPTSVESQTGFVAVSLRLALF